MNNWLKILEAFQNGKFPDYYYGLTPRFIIGGCQIPIGSKFETKELAEEAVKEMFNEMQEFNMNGTIVVSNKCGIHNGPVMSLSTTQWTKESIGTSFEEIWARYEEEIVNGNYHINNNELKVLQEIYNVT